MEKKKKDSCIFCSKLKNNDGIIFEDDLVFVFHDKKDYGSKCHLLICPKEHIISADSLKSFHVPLI